MVKLAISKLGQPNYLLAFGCDLMDATASMAQLTAWVDSPERGYRQAAREEFLRIADYYLVAQAHAGKHTVVTSELPAPESKRRILIPDACNAMNVAYKEPFWVYKRLGLRFS